MFDLLLLCSQRTLSYRQMYVHMIYDTYISIWDTYVITFSHYPPTCSITSPRWSSLCTWYISTRDKGILPAKANGWHSKLLAQKISEKMGMKQVSLIPGGNED